MIIKTFDELRNHIRDMREDTLELLNDSLEESTEFQRGSYHGEIYGYDEVLEILRSILKHGEV